MTPRKPSTSGRRFGDTSRHLACGLAAAALVVTGCGRFGFDSISSSPSESDWSFLDDGPSAFDLGNYQAGAAPLIWRDDRVEFSSLPPFAPDQPGIYVSRPFDTGDDSALWETLAWVPVAPHGRPLPDSGASDSGYLDDGLSMADNILLLHFDDTASADGDPVVDRSGQEHDGQLVLAGQTASPIDGEFTQALDLDRDAWVTLDGSYFDYGTGDFTYAVWVKMRPCSESNDNRIALGGAGAGDDPHMWIGSRCPEVCPGGDGAFMNFLDATRDGPSLEACSGVVLDDGEWHHLAGVKQGHTAPPALVQLFVDGREVAAESYDFSAPLTYDGGEIRLGSFNLNDPQYHTRITVDEAAIWKRALTAAEVGALYRRGAVQLELQFRACPDGMCDTEPFIGPDGTIGSYFTEADLSGAPGSQLGNLASLGLVGSQAQYRVRFDTTAAMTSPGLRSVRLEARKP